ncbi:threonine/serine dehydratase [Candidatus Bathyarchaeota archaeon]|nr:threonine/serine dehydratase [Candidatus Bathyarchaeota archaeon]
MISLKDVYSAKKRIGPFIRKTPLDYSPVLSKHIGAEVWLKYENFQITGSFKIRGAANSLLSLNSEQKKRGIVTSSAGNHGMGLGYIGKVLGINVRVYLPINTPSVKVTGLKQLGVEVILYGNEYLESERSAIEDSLNNKRFYVSPYNNYDVIAGQATIGLEMLEDNPELDTILVPLGGGGLISGIGSVWKQATGAKIIGVQSEASPVMYESIKTGRIIEIPLKESVAEGLHGGIEPDSITFNICKECVDDYIIVKESSIIDSMKFMIYRHHLILEGAGAVGIAALIDETEKFRDKKIGVVLSGSNIDEFLLKKLF